MPPAVPPEVLGSGLLRGLAPEDRDEILAAAVPRRLARGEVLFRQGDPVEALYLVEGGRLRLAATSAAGDEVIVQEMAAGDVVAGVAVLERRTLPVTATATTATRVLVWPRATAGALAERFPRLRVNVLETIADRMQASLRRIGELSTESVPQRLARVLLRLARHDGRSVADGVLIDQPLRRQDLAQMTAASMFTVSRLLAEWSRQGILDAGRQRIVVRSRERLEELAGAPSPP